MHSYASSQVVWLHTWGWHGLPLSTSMQTQKKKNQQQRQSCLTSCYSCQLWPSARAWHARVYQCWCEKRSRECSVVFSITLIPLIHTENATKRIPAKSRVLTNADIF